MPAIVETPLPVTAITPPAGWMSNQPSLSDAALAVSGMNYAAKQEHSHFVGHEYSIGAAYYRPGVDTQPGAVGLYRRSILE